MTLRAAQAEATEPVARSDAPDASTVPAGDVAVTGLRILGLDTLQAPLRVLNLFAQFDLLPDSVSIERQADRFELVVMQRDLTPPGAEMLLQKLRAMVLVTDAWLEPPAGHA